MNLLKQAFEFMIHLDVHLATIISQYGSWTYILVFAVLFAETGLVVIPFLPGDSLLFALGTFAATGTLNIWVLAIGVLVAVFLGDNTNYWIGHHIGPKLFSGKKLRWLNENHLRETQNFYAKHGGKTIILARFLPIIRTFAPFVAGVGKMPYGEFISYSLVGVITWAGLALTSGYLFGNIPIVRQNFSAVIFVIIGISVIPPLIKVIHQRLNKNSISDKLK